MSSGSAVARGFLKRGVIQRAGRCGDLLSDTRRRRALCKRLLWKRQKPKKNQDENLQIARWRNPGTFGGSLAHADPQDRWAQVGENGWIWAAGCYQWLRASRQDFWHGGHERVNWQRATSRI